MSKICLIYFFVHSLKRSIQAEIKGRQDALKEVSESIAASAVSLAVEMDADCSTAHQKVQSAFDALTRCSCIWDITSGSDIDRVKSRSAASMSVERSITKCLQKEPPGITSPATPLVFLNRNGADIYMY